MKELTAGQKECLTETLNGKEFNSRDYYKIFFFLKDLIQENPENFNDEANEDYEEAFNLLFEETLAILKQSEIFYNPPVLTKEYVENMHIVGIISENTKNKLLDSIDNPVKYDILNGEQVAKMPLCPHCGKGKKTETGLCSECGKFPPIKYITENS